MPSCKTHLQRGHSIGVDYASVTAELKQLAYYSRVAAFGRVHERSETQLVSFVDSALRKAVGTPHAVNYDAHVSCEGSEMQVGVPGEAS